MSFDKWLEELKATEAAKTDPAPAPDEKPAEPEPEDPLAKYIGNREGRLGEPTEFERLLEQIEAEKPEDFAFTPSPPEQHEWVSQRDAKYSEDHAVWVCKKCIRTVHVGRAESVGTALERTGIRSDCSAQIVSEVQET